MYCTPGPLNSILIKTEKAVPNNPENNAKIKYKFPISLAFVEKNHLSTFKLIEDKLIFFILDFSWSGRETNIFLAFLELVHKGTKF